MMQDIQCCLLLALEFSDEGNVLLFSLFLAHAYKCRQLPLSFDTLAPCGPIPTLVGSPGIPLGTAFQVEGGLSCRA